MAKTVVFQRAFSDVPKNGVITVRFSPDGLIATVQGRASPAAIAIVEAKRLAHEQKAKLAAYIWRRDQWNSDWGSLV